MKRIVVIQQLLKRQLVVHLEIPDEQLKEKTKQEVTEAFKKKCLSQAEDFDFHPATSTAEEFLQGYSIGGVFNPDFLQESQSEKG
jgi:hypothetical protein